MKKYKRYLMFVVMLVIVLVINIPIVNMIGTSLKPEAMIFRDNSLFPTKVSFENYNSVFNRTPFFTFLYNTSFISVTVTLFCTLISAFAGYVISRFRFKLRFLNWYSNMLLVLQMFPVILMLIPLFIMFKGYGIVDTKLSVILIYGTFSLPFNIWMLAGFFNGIPAELEEAGVIDGCSRFQCFYKLILPVSGPGIASVAIFTFIYCWNEYLLASIFLKNEGIRTLQLGLQTFMQQFNYQWGSLTAASTLTIIPAIFLLIFMQKYIVQGMTAGAVKG